MRRTSRVLFSTAAIAGLGLIPAGHAAATTTTGTATTGTAVTGTALAAAAAPAYGFVLADQPGSPSSVGNPRMSANSTGATNTITRHGVGDYSVRLPGLGATAGGNAQVTAYGDDANRCKTSYWLPDAGAMVVGVVCDTPAGAAVDTPFVAQFWRGAAGNPHQSAHLLANRPAEAAYTADPVYSYNSTGGANRITRTGTGAYTVGFGGFRDLAGIVHVTATGFSSDVCKVRSWGAAAADVRCFTAAGQPKDTSFSLRYTDRHLANGSADLGGYAWANRPDAPIGVAYVPDGRHSFNMLGQTNTVTHRATGRYTVHFPRIPAFDAGSPMATGHGAGGVTCKVDELFASGSGSRVDVDCRTPAGAPADASFTVSQSTDL